MAMCNRNSYCSYSEVDKLYTPQSVSLIVKGLGASHRVGLN